MQEPYFDVVNIWQKFVKIRYEVSYAIVCVKVMRTTKMILNYIINTVSTGMRRITTFRSTTDRIYDGGPIRL